MLDLHEGILSEFAERASRSIEDEAHASLFGLRIVTPRTTAKDVAALRASRKARRVCIYCGDSELETGTQCARHAAISRDRMRKAA